MIIETVPREAYDSGYGALPHLAIEIYKWIDMNWNTAVEKLKD